MSLDGKGKSLCRGCRRVRNNTPCPSARPSFDGPQARPAVSLVDAGMFLPTHPASILSGRRFVCPFLHPPPRHTRAMPSPIRPPLTPVPFQFVNSHPCLGRRRSLFLLHQRLEEGLEVEVGRVQVLVHCSGGFSQHALTGKGGKGGDTHAQTWRRCWRRRAASTWRRPPWPCLLTAACAHTRAASRPPSARR